VVFIAISTIFSPVTIATFGESQQVYIQITSDGHIFPSSAPIHRNGDIYTLTSDIDGTISVEKCNAILNGADYETKNINFWDVENLILENLNVATSVLINGCTNTTIRNCTIVSENEGVWIANSVYTTIYYSNISTSGNSALIIGDSQINNIT
jgi:hypothetical protein